MSRTAAQVLASRMDALIPRGFTWPSDVSSNVAGYLYPGSGLVADAEAFLDALKLEINPATATLLLDDYEQTLGPDPCGRDALVSTIPLRQALAHQRWVAVGDNSIPGLVALAAAVGVDITIDEPEPALCGAAVLGVDVCSQVSDRLIWVVQITPTDRPLAPQAAVCGVAATGVSVCGDVLLPVIANVFAMLTCPITRESPADTTVVFGWGAGRVGVSLDAFNLNVDGVS